MRLSALTLCTFLLFAGVERPDAAPPAATHADSLARAEDFYQLGYAEYSPGRLDPALALFDSALTFNPLLAAAWHGRGSTLARLNRHEDAQRAFDEALRLKPDYGTAWWHRGCDNAVAGRADTALSDLRHAIALDSAFKAWPFSDPCWNTLLNDSALLKLTFPYTPENAPKE
jgi:tetratricopeptide (TPR) repeat protein